MNFIEKKLNLIKNIELFEFITFWIYYKKIDLEKCLINLTENKLKYVINEFFLKNPEYRKENKGLITTNKIKTSEYNFINDNSYVNYFNNFIIDDNDNNFLRVCNYNYQSLPFPLFIPFIKKISEFKIKEIITNEYFKNYQELKIISNDFNYKNYWIKFEDIISYISDDFKELINIIFEWYKNKKSYIELDINIKEYFEYMQNIM